MSVYEFDSQGFEQALTGTRLEGVAKELATHVAQQGHALKHGHLPRWQSAIEQLPQLPQSNYYLDNGMVCIDLPQSMQNNSELREQMIAALKLLMPWRKGPFRIGDIVIDTEWRSDWKWERLAPHIKSLKSKTVLDVGCGSGYHLWRMHEAGASTVVGIDPSLLFVHQFAAIQHIAQQPQIHLLPLSMEALTPNLQLFDTVFSMGVLYHRRNPLEHLQALLEALAPDGELVLETLIIPGADDNALVLEGRYANMRNLYELPTASRLCRWLREAGLKNLRVVDVGITECTEQRSTDWMTSHSLEQALDAMDQSRTIEGHPRPLRAIVLAGK